MSRPEKPDVSDDAVCEWGRLQADRRLPLSDVLPSSGLGLLGQQQKTAAPESS